MKADYIQEYLFENKDEFVNYLLDMVRLESPSHNPSSQEPVLTHIAKPLQDIGYTVKHHKGAKTGGFLECKPLDFRGESKQVLIGHADTVWPEGTITSMPAELDDNVAHGPGIYDMKAGLTMVVFALKALNKLQVKPSVVPVFLATTDEEIGSKESKDFIEKVASESCRAMILEPSLGPSGKIKTGRKGVGHFEIYARGKAAHAGLAPEEGASAILELSHVIQHLFALNDPDKGITVNVGTIGGGLRSNVVAPESHATIDVRILKQKDARRIEKIIYSMKPSIKGVSLDITGGMDRPPMELTKRNHLLWNLARDLGEEIGLALEGGISGGGSDGNFTSQITATLDGLGAVGDGAHAIHEHIRIDETLKRCTLLALLIANPDISTSSNKTKWST